MNKLIKFSGAKWQSGVSAVSSKKIKFYLQKTKTILVLAMFLFAGLQGCKKKEFKEPQVKKDKFKELLKTDGKLLKSGKVSYMTIKKTDKGETEVFYATTDKFTKKDFIERANAFRKANGRKVKYVFVLKNVSNNFDFEKIKSGGHWVKVCMGLNWSYFLDCCREWRNRGFQVYVRIMFLKYEAIVWMSDDDEQLWLK